ncbi:hypothetical protein OJAV_G00161680 [Oryzias javanicus]|uniref:Uncharacterized protein n=1 Tax=Oryzias javanicus TaxID=123683 RepID=A0A3S2MMK7_ORYJA|nr:hypothetical protein OJAV_G00161680 [Oryzias javanicus]
MSARQRALNGFLGNAACGIDASLGARLVVNGRDSPTFAPTLPCLCRQRGAELQSRESERNMTPEDGGRGVGVRSRVEWCESEWRD